jgi:GNAT superfamily N-acetyltransferase
MAAATKIGVPGSSSGDASRTQAGDWTRGEYTLSRERARLDLDAIHAFLAESYWAKGRSKERVARSIEHSLPFAIYERDRLVAFARVVSDEVVVAFLCDVFVLPEHRGQGLSQWLMQAILAAPELQGIRRFMLGTRDAHGLYRKFGFAEPAPGILMERLDPESDRRA